MGVLSKNPKTKIMERPKLDENGNVKGGKADRLYIPSEERIKSGVKVVPKRENIQRVTKKDKKVLDVQKSVIECALVGAKVLRKQKEEQEIAEKRAKAEKKALEREIRTADSLKELVSILNSSEKLIEKEDEQIKSCKGFFLNSNYVRCANVLIDNPHSSEEEKKYYLERALVYAKRVTDFWFDLRENFNSGRYTLFKVGVKEMIEKGDLSDELYNELFLSCFDIMARNYDFKCYMVALEWNRPANERYFLPRMKCFENLETIEGDKVNLIQDVQDYIDNKIDIFMNIMPQRLGKTGLRVFAETLLMPKVGYNKAFFDLTYSTELSIHIFEEMVDIFTNRNKYRYFEIFKGHKLYEKSKDSHSLNIDCHNSFDTFTSRSIDSSITGTIEMSGMAGIDDIISGIDDILNPETCNKIWSKFNTYILARMKKGVRLMATATLWGDYCPLTRFIKIIKEWIEKGQLNKERVRIRRFAWCNSNGECQFDYEFGLGFDTAHFKRLETSMGSADPALWQAMCMANPISREGRPLQNLKFYTELPKEEPDRKAIAIDTALGSKDYYAGCIGYIYENRKQVYFTDVIYTKKDTDFSLPYTAEKIKLHNISACSVEEKEPAPKNATIRFGIGQKLHELLIKDGYGCNIFSKSASGEAKKRDRILSAKSAILGIDTNKLDWQFFFLDKSCRQYNEEYQKFIENIQFWSEEERAQKKQQDGAPDCLAQFWFRVLSMATKKKEAIICSIKF